MNDTLSQARMLLGVWGSYPSRVSQLRQEQAWARRAWQEDDEALRENSLRLQASIEAEIAETLRLARVMDELVQALPPLERQVEHLRCREGMRYVPMSFKLHYSPDYLRHVKQRADERIAAMLEDAPIDSAGPGNVQ